MKIEDFDYELPRELIAQFPPPKRDDARLMVLGRSAEEIHHSRFLDLSDWLQPEDLLVVNDTKVIPARLRGRKPSGAKVEILLCEPTDAQEGRVPPTADAGAFRNLTWRCLVRCRGAVFDDLAIIFGEKAWGSLVRLPEGKWCITFHGIEDVRQVMEEAGDMPLPPYIRREPRSTDRLRYQTLFARADGSIAAPTAGLHFTDEVLERLKESGVSMATLTLHIGVGTFLPVKSSRVEDHLMHPEYVEVGEGCCRAWHETRSRGGRVVGVGTTTVRALETAYKPGEGVAPFQGFTSLFILPGHRFRAVDALITNFHLPRSTLLMLVMALAGRHPIKRAYNEAIREGYRFYSYGDAMLIQ
jgi:S-adenosylmethionine:tRNA ribosyltransferase-isomerase